MATFTTLSNELILVIWDFVEVEDVYNFSTISKQVYSLVRKVLREHCQLMKRLSTISNVAAESGELVEPGIFGRTLKEVLVNPRSARYPSLLEVGEWQGEWEQERGHFRAMVPKEDLELFKQAARDNIDVEELDEEEDLEEDWLAAIDKGDEEPLIALLLLLLPNLREVHLGAIREYHFCIETALEIIIDDKCSRKLRSVNLECMATTWQGPLSFDHVEAFAAIPSVTSIHGHTVDTYQQDPKDRLYYWDSHIRTTDIVSLTFVSCSIDPRTLATFLSTTRNLRHFFYSAKEADEDKFEPLLLCTALLANARDTLRSLIILADGQETSFMGSLKDFSCLESVQTDLRLLIGDPLLLARSPPAVLPSSIVSITLHIDNCDATYWEDLIPPIADYPTHFHQLAKITVISVADVHAEEASHEDLIRVLEERGTKLAFEKKGRIECSKIWV